MVKKDYKELDETIRGKVVQFLYNQGDGKKVPIAHLACLRNRDRSKSKQVRICTYSYEPCTTYTVLQKYRHTRNLLEIRVAIKRACSTSAQVVYCIVDGDFCLPNEIDS